MQGQVMAAKPRRRRTQLQAAGQGQDHRAASRSGVSFDGWLLVGAPGMQAGHQEQGGNQGAQTKHGIFQWR